MTPPQDITSSPPGHRALSAVLELSRLTCLRLYCPPTFNETSYMAAMRAANLSAQEEAVFAGELHSLLTGLFMQCCCWVRISAQQFCTMKASATCCALHRLLRQMALPQCAGVLQGQHRQAGCVLADCVPSLYMTSAPMQVCSPGVMPRQG